MLSQALVLTLILFKFLTPILKLSLTYHFPNPNGTFLSPCLPASHSP